MTDLTLVTDSMLSEELVRKEDFLLPGDRVTALSERIHAIKKTLEDKQKVTDPIQWNTLKNKGFAWNELPGVPYASQPQYGITMLSNDISTPIRDEDHYVAATCYAVSQVPVGSEGIVPITRTINGKPLSEDVWITAEDVGSYSKEYMMDALRNLDATYQLYVPDRTTINGHPLTSDVWLTSFEVGVMTKEDWQQEYNKRLQEMWDSGGLLGYSGKKSWDPNVFEPIGITGAEFKASARGLQVRVKGKDYSYGSEVMADNYDEFVVMAQIDGSPNLNRDYYNYVRVSGSRIPVKKVYWEESLAAMRAAIDRWYEDTRDEDILDMSKFHFNGVKLSYRYKDTSLYSGRGLGIGDNYRFCWGIPADENFIVSIGGMNTKSAGQHLKSIGAATRITRTTSVYAGDMSCDVKMIDGIATVTKGYCTFSVSIGSWTTVSQFGRGLL